VRPPLRLLLALLALLLGCDVPKPDKDAEWTLERCLQYDVDIAVNVGCSRPWKVPEDYFGLNGLSTTQQTQFDAWAKAAAECMAGHMEQVKALHDKTVPLICIGHGAPPYAVRREQRKKQLRDATYAAIDRWKTKAQDQMDQARTSANDALLWVQAMLGTNAADSR
jgi:hypothetical protein